MALTSLPSPSPTITTITTMPSTDPVILLTGASRGLGLAIAQHLLNHSTANLHLVSRSAIPLTSPRITSTLIDLSTPSAASTAVTDCLAHRGRIDTLILNHGTLSPVSRIADASIPAWRAAFDTNFFSIVGLIQLSLPSLRAAPEGRVIMISSGAAVAVYPAWGAYGAAKAAINHLALTLATEEPGVTTVAVRPGIVDTGMQKEIREMHLGAMGSAGERFVDAHREGKLLAPEVPGAVVARMAVGVGRELGGRFLRYVIATLGEGGRCWGWWVLADETVDSWNAEELREFQDDAPPA